MRCPRVLSFRTCLALRVLPLPAQGIVRLTAPYITNDNALEGQAAATPLPGQFLDVLPRRRPPITNLGPDQSQVTTGMRMNLERGYNDFAGVGGWKQRTGGKDSRVGVGGSAGGAQVSPKRKSDNMTLTLDSADDMRWTRW